MRQNRYASISWYVTRECLDENKQISYSAAIPPNLSLPMISIRLSRVGTKRAPVYRVVVMPKHNDPWAIATEILGHYNPRKTPHELVLNTDRVKYWLDKGAEPSDTMWNLLVDQKIVEGKKRSVSHISGTRAKKLEGEAAEAKAKSDEATAKAKEATQAAKAVAEAPAPEPEPVPEAPVAQAPAPEAPAQEQPAPTLSEAEVGAPTDNVGAQ